MELSDATEKTPATPEIDPGTFRLVAQCLNHYAIYIYALLKLLVFLFVSCILLGTVYHNSPV
jgi:hypothetical protein